MIYLRDVTNSTHTTHADLIFGYVFLSPKLSAYLFYFTGSKTISKVKQYNNAVIFQKACMIFFKFQINFKTTFWTYTAHLSAITPECLFFFL